MDEVLKDLIKAGDEAAAAVLAEPGLHRPRRPTWTCADDGEDWPCSRLRAHLLTTTDRRGIDLVMGAHAHNAASELGLPSSAVHQRFYSWHRYDDLRRPPGGPW